MNLPRLAKETTGKGLGLKDIGHSRDGSICGGIYQGSVPANPLLYDCPIRFSDIDGPKA